jgi:hypothetical protein
MRAHPTFARLLVGLAAVCLLGSPGEADAITIKNLEFNVDGVLPSAEPDIDLQNSSSQTETSVYSVSGGFLAQSTFGIGVGNVSYLFPNLSITGGGLDPTLATVMEARLSISQIEGNAGAFFQAHDGVYRYSVFFQSGGANVLSASGQIFVAIPDLSAFHTYRIVSPGSSNAIQFFIDNVLVLTTTAASNSLNGFGFGDGVTASGNNADASWDFVRVSQVPEPSAVALLGAGLAGLLLYGRRRS